MTDKRCGTCGWWKEFQGSYKPVLGKCEWPIGDYADSCFVGRDSVNEGEGERCPCWKEQVDD
ncbi:MAG TPA: hypothetical protein ENI23_06280 [bacterium]|nr:hypothetical protein [bacterium]